MTGKRDREVLLRQEAAKQLATGRGGKFQAARVGHACGTAGQLEVWFESGKPAESFRAELLDGGIVALKVLPRRRVNAP